MSGENGLGRSPTFLVGSATQQYNLEQLQRREQHLAEQYQKGKPLCFSSGAFQKTHPQKAAKPGHVDADVTLTSPMLLGVADGVSQIAEFGMDPSELPIELMAACKELADEQLIPDKKMQLPSGAYRGPIDLMKRAYEATESMGSTTALLAVMDNSTQIHGKLHPMLAVLSIGDCEIIILQQSRERKGLDMVFHTEMQRIDGHAQCPLQICRVDERIDPDFDESMPVAVIERGSAVHCVTAYEGDIVIMGSDGVFDNLFIDEIVDICNQFFSPRSTGGTYEPTDKAILDEVARRIVAACHAKTHPGPSGIWPDAPIGKGGKKDDTCCVVGEVVEWTQAHADAWAKSHRQKRWHDIVNCSVFSSAPKSDDSDDDDDSEEESSTCAIA